MPAVSPAMHPAPVLRTLVKSQSELACSFSEWAQSRTLSDIAHKSARLLARSLSGQAGFTPMCRLAAITLASAVNCDPYYPTPASKQARLKEMTDEASGQNPKAWGMYVRLLREASQADFVRQERASINGAHPFSEAVRTLFGMSFTPVRPMVTPDIAPSGFDCQALAAIGALSARIVQARFREEIFREHPDLFEEVAGNTSLDDIVAHLNAEADRAAGFAYHQRQKVA